MKNISILACLILLCWVSAEWAEQKLLFNSPTQFAALSKRPLREELAKGKFLIANPQLQGTYFGETIILLTDHSASGSMGLIVNRPTNIELSALGSEFKGIHEENRLYIGGPVARSQAFLLIQTPSPPDDAIHVLENIYFGGSRRLFETVSQFSNPGEQFRVYLGYAGWWPGQLEQEIREGAWQVVSGNSAMVFQSRQRK